MDGIARTIGTVVRYAVWGLLGAVLVLGILLTIPGLPTWLKGTWRVLGVVAVTAVAAATLVNTFNDASGWAARPGQWAERVVRARLVSWLDLGDEPHEPSEEST